MLKTLVIIVLAIVALSFFFILLRVGRRIISKKLVTKEVDIHDTDVTQFFKSDREINMFVCLGIAVLALGILLHFI